jgi:acylphosphatase
MKRVRAYYSGDVQGVGFRFTAVDVARRYGVKGWVRNAPDGGVELIAEAKEPALDSFLKEIKSAMSRYIREEQTSSEPPTGEFKDFQIRF